MTILEDRTHSNRRPAGRELGVEMSEALSEAKRLRRRIGRLLAAAQDGTDPYRQWPSRQRWCTRISSAT